MAPFRRSAPPGSHSAQIAWDIDAKFLQEQDMFSIDRAPAAGPPPIDELKATRAARQGMIERLRELVAAINRRVPRAGHAGEAQIANDAEKLRTRALDQIAQLESPDADVQD